MKVEKYKEEENNLKQERINLKQERVKLNEEIKKQQEQLKEKNDLNKKNIDAEQNLIELLNYYSPLSHYLVFAIPCKYMRFCLKKQSIDPSFLRIVIWFLFFPTSSTFTIVLQKNSSIIFTHKCKILLKTIHFPVGISLFVVETADARNTRHITALFGEMWAGYRLKEKTKYELMEKQTKLQSQYGLFGKFVYEDDIKKQAVAIWQPGKLMIDLQKKINQTEL